MAVRAEEHVKVRGAATVGTNACSACGSSRTRRVLEVSNVPVFCNVLFDNADDARSVVRGSIALVYCEDCTFLFNETFDESLLAYSPEYANSLSCSPRFGTFLQEMSERLVKKHGLQGKSVLELGCGDGDFVRRLCSVGNNRGFGFDPSYRGASKVDVGQGVTFETSYYVPGQSTKVNPDLVCSRHVLEHVSEPLEFMKLLAGAATPTGASLYIEVPSANYMLEKTAIWDLIYEHPGYFTDRALVSLAEKSGLRVTGAEPVFLDQFIYIDAESDDSTRTSFVDQTAGRDALAGMVSGFRDEFEASLKRWDEELGGLERNGKKVVTWGAGSKGVTFLNLVGKGIEHIVDINPDKQGRFVPGTAQSVVGPEFLAEYRPDVVLLMNGAYEAEVRKQVQDLDIDATVKVVT